MRVFVALVAILATALIGGAVAPTAHAVGPNAIVHNQGCNTNALFPNDDGSTGFIPIPFTINFFGDEYGGLWANNNGNLTFDGPMSTYTPFPIGTTNRPIIAPFFGDVDTRGSGSGVLTYGMTTFGGHDAFCALWDDVGVGYYGGHVDKLNMFQVLLVERSDTGPGNFDIVFNYDQIQWETGDASGGSGGLGGSSARIGYANGTSASFELPGSAINGAFLDSNANTGLVHNSVNSPLQLGRYIFPVRNGAATGHSISGHVWANSPGTPAGGAFLQACPTPLDTPCRNASANAAGFYSFNNLPDSTSGGGAVDHDWNIVVYPPSGSGLGVGSAGPIPVAGSDVFDQDIVLHGPIAPPAGTSVNNAPPGMIPVVVVGQPVHLVTTGCDGGNATYTVTGTYGGSTSGSMVEGPAGTYTADFVLTFTGPAHVTIVIDGCPTIEFDIYIDPSGFVRNPAGQPVEGATVTLLRADDPAGPFVVVPDGSAIMSPANRTNPDLTDATGHFGWDVLAGYYLVRAEKADCGPAVESAVLTIPPPVTDLLLVLDCPVGDATPPVISVPGDIMSEATGPDGAAVTYSASAEDEVDGSVEVDCAPASGSTFPLGATVVTCTAEDAAGNVAEETFTVSVVDTTAPSLTVPADITVDATSPAGAVVTYSASAFDIVDGSVTPTCSPASGETFAIGDTTVTCTAEDAAGNAAEASFVVHVSGAGEQVADLIAASTGVGPGSSLADKARQVQAYLDAGQIEDACGTLKAYLNEVKAQTGKKVTAAQAATLAAQVNQIRAVLDC